MVGAGPVVSGEVVAAVAELRATDLLDALPQIIWVSDARGIDRVANRRWAEFTGLDQPDVEQCHALLHPEDRARTLGLWRRSVATGAPFEADFRLRRHDGAWRWHLARAHAERDASGQVVRWVGTATDIEAQFRAAHESALDGFMVLRNLRDAAGIVGDFRWLYVNEAAARILHRPRDAFAGRRLLEELPGARAAGLLDDCLRVAASGQPVSRDLRYAGEGLELELRVALAPADDGVAISFSDQTERRRAERELQALQARQAFLLALGDRLRSLTDPHAAMQAAAEMLGRHLQVGRCGYAELDEDGEHLLIEPGWNDGTMSSPAGRYRLQDLGMAMFDELRAGRTLRIDDTRSDRRVGPRAAHDRELRASIAAPLIKFGRLVALLYVHESLPRHWSDDEAQLVREVAERTWSSSERARAVRALQQSEERLRLATEGVGLGTWETDLASGETRWSQSQFRIFGVEPTPDGRLAPGGLRRLLHPDEHSRLAAAFERARAGEPYRPEFRVIRADDGAERWIAAFGRVIPGAHGGAGRFVGITMDITERKRLEAERESLLESERAARGAAEAATRAKDEFLATLSHELRTPLSVIISWSRVLQRRFETGDPDLRRGLKTIADNAFAQSQLMSDLLDMSRIVSGKLTLDLRPVDLRELVADAVDARLPEAEARQVTLTRRLPADLEPALMLAEPGRLHQVLGNLLGNALKFTPAGGAIEVALERRGAELGIAVRDDGEGIAAAFLPHVFERFRQAEGGAARRHGGLGLGLSVVRQLVELHGGRVAVHSDGPGRGATFQLWLPAHAAESAMAGDDPAGGAPGDVTFPALGSAALAGRRVLAVEDEPSMREYLVRVLEEQGARVTAAASAGEALAQLEAARGSDGDCGFDLLVSDIGLPGGDGYELLRAVRSLPGHGPGQLGALALTAFARDEDRRRCLDAGYQEHLGKPYDVAQLVALLRRLTPR